MSEDFVLVTAALERLRCCTFGTHLDAFCARLAELGYQPSTIRSKLGIVCNLARWMEQEQVAPADLDELRVEAFLAARRGCGGTGRGSRRTALQLLEQLREAGIVRAPELIREATPGAALVARYANYLRAERALAPATLTGYLRFVRAFVLERLGDGAISPGEVHARDVRDFLLVRVGDMAPRYAQQMAIALRSFLRFLFLTSETETNLALAVPTVRQWRLAGVPRGLAAPEVERLLDACDLTAAVGRRDRAILLLMARLGLRAGEVVALELDDLRWRDGAIVVRGKGLMRDRLPLLSEVGDALARYLRSDRPAGASRRVFLCRRAPYRGFAHASSVSTIVARGLARAGLAPPTRGAHLLRHGLATALLRRGASLSEIGELLRHRSPATTEIYAKLDFDALRDVALPWPTAGGVR